jgi:RNA polymerase sigma-70 factor (ECF subfamily)
VSLDRSIAEQVFRENERFIFGIAYRLLGTVADAEDVVQETFARALGHPPERTDEPWRPWLVRVALNLGRDALRRRRRRTYVGPWLPSPVEEAAAPDEGPDVRYGRIESASAAFLLALEVLTPKARAVLILRDAFGYSVRETAAALEVTEPDVKTTHHRARRALASYDGARRPPSPDRQAETRAALERFLTAVALEDPAAVVLCLASSVRATSDGGGEFHAALLPVVGREKVARFFLGLQRKTRGLEARFEVQLLNGLPAVVVAYETAPEKRYATRFVLRGEVDSRGKLAVLEILIAERKLAGVRFP